jgi:DNA helicase HerA-like ATPase
MAFTYDLSTNIGLIRLRINDKYADDPIFRDEELDAFLLFNNTSVLLAAAMALETIAADEVLVQKVIRLGSLSTDGAKIAAELRANAALLRAQYASGASTGGGADSGFDIAEQVYTVFNEREYITSWAARYAS